MDKSKANEFSAIAYADKPEMYLYIYLQREVNELEENWKYDGGKEFSYHLNEMKRIIDLYLNYNK